MVYLFVTVLVVGFTCCKYVEAQVCLHSRDREIDLVQICPTGCVCPGVGVAKGLVSLLWVDPAQVSCLVITPDH